MCPSHFILAPKNGLNPNDPHQQPHQQHFAIPICSSSPSQPDLILPPDNMETIVLGGVGGPVSLRPVCERLMSYLAHALSAKHSCGLDNQRT